MSRPRTLRTALAAGLLMAPAALAKEDLVALVSHRFTKGEIVGHVYYNPASGERVITPYVPASQRSEQSCEPVWLNNNFDPCNTGGAVGIIDDPDLNGDGRGDLFGGDCESGTFPCEGSWNLWWGDIATDSVIDCVVLAYAIAAPDFDADGDSIGNGIVGYDLAITFSDNDNGFDASGRSCILDLTIPTIPGQVKPQPPFLLAQGYWLTIDLGDTEPYLAFELGDSDGVDDSGAGLSGAALYGFPTARDLDGDGLHDFSYAMRFDQSSLDTSGNPGQSKGYNGFLSVAPKLGSPGDDPPHPADATGIFDMTDIYTSGPSCAPNETNYIGSYNFGGFTCDPSKLGFEVPYSSAYIELYSRNANTTCRADLDNSGAPADFTDILFFITDYTGDCTFGVGNFDRSSGGDPNNCDFSDIIAYLTSFSSPGCGA